MGLFPALQAQRKNKTQAAEFGGPEPLIFAPGILNDKL